MTRPDPSLQQQASVRKPFGRTCASCGVANDGGARFCDSCGQPLSA